MKDKEIKRNFELNPKFKNGFKENCFDLSVIFINLL